MHRVARDATPLRKIVKRLSLMRGEAAGSRVRKGYSPGKGSVYPISDWRLGQVRSVVGDVHRAPKTEIMFKRDTSGRWICTCGRPVDEHSHEELSKCVQENNTVVLDGDIVITMNTVTHKTE
jgi:hypothetical protein